MRIGYWLCLAAGLALMPAPLMANATAGAEALKTLAQIETDPAKLKAYCASSKALLAAPPDQMEAVADMFDETVRAFGEAFGAALDLHYELDDASPDGAALVALFQKLDGLCGN
ncbi:MAG: hypothetical protein SH859_13525 [Hyphomicrobium aestuarii]|nr:hypothetical protein [Hyphomicrobium aestuarii]